MGSNCSIKDKNNLLNHNHWSCGSYINSLQGFYVNQIGSYVIKDGLRVTQRTPANWGYFDLIVSALESNTNYYFEAVIKNNAVWHMSYVEDGATIVKVVINPSSTYQTISLSFTTSSSTSRGFRWFNDEDNCIIELKSLDLHKR